LAGRTPRAALADFIEPLREVFRCVTEMGFVPGGSQPGGPYTAFLQGRVASLRRGSGLDLIRLRAAIDYTIDASAARPGWWDVRMTGWIYEIRPSSDAPILAFHWHPVRGRVTWPHLHAYGAHDAVDLHKLHPPTGHVTLRSVVRFLIEDFGMLPRRAAWPAVLERHASV
jgi:hypothetical protein